MRIPFWSAATFQAGDHQNKYLITADAAAGRLGRYTVIRYSHQDAEVVGRELTLSHAKRLVRDSIRGGKTMKDFG